MNRSILIIVQSEAALKQVQQFSRHYDLKAVLGIEAGIEQLYQINFDGVLYEPDMDKRQERKLRKLITLQSDPPAICIKDPQLSWADSLGQLIKSIPPRTTIIDGGFENALFKVCLN